MERRQGGQAERMTPLWFIVGALIGCALAHLARLILETEWRPRRCQRGKPCGCYELKGRQYDHGKYRLCDDTPAKEGNRP